jgi:uncharacterized protein (TIGR03435 family)
MTRALASALLAVLLAASGIAQSTPARLSFEVADIKVSPAGTQMSFEMLPGGKLTAHGVPMKMMIAAAYEVDDSFVEGPSWLASERYDIVAKAPHNAPEKDMVQMLQSLLIERFKLEVHRDKKIAAVYALTFAKKTGKLQESAAGDTEQNCKLQLPQQRKDGLLLRTWSCTNTNMDNLADSLGQVAAAYVDLPVVNLTELKGAYDFSLEWAPRRAGRGAAARGEPPPTADPDGPNIFEAVGRLGLKLEQRRMPMDIIVVDKMERTPTEN